MQETVTRRRASIRSLKIIKSRNLRSRKVDSNKQKLSDEKKITKRAFLKDLLIISTLGYTLVTKGIYSTFDEKPPTRLIASELETEWKNGEEQNTEIAKSALQKKIEQYIEQMQDSGKIAQDETVAWFVYDLINKKELVMINENLPLQSASMVKPLVALAFFHKVKNGELEYTEKCKRYLVSMIQRSRNYTTNWIMEQIGGPKEVNKILLENYGDIFHHIDIVEYIPLDGTTYRNKASASDYNRFLCALWNNTLPYSEEIKRLMALPKGGPLGDYPYSATVMNKTGNTARLCGDMAILEVKSKKGTFAYTLITIIEKKQNAEYYAGWKRVKKSVIREGSNIVHEFVKETYGVG